MNETITKKPENDNSGSAIYTGGSMVAMRSCLVNILVEMIDLGGMEVGRKAKFSPDAIANEIREALAVQTEEYGQGSDEWKDICAKCMDGDIEPKFCAYYGEPNGCNSPIYGEHPTTEKSSEVGNAAVLREALSDACYAMFNFLKTQNGGYEEMAEALDKAKAALAAPARNCERYATPDAAELAFDDYCHDRRENPVEVCRRKSCRDCQREWLYAAAKEGGAHHA